MAKGGPKQYPNLALYLERATKVRKGDARMALTIILAGVGSLSFIFGSVITFMAIRHHNLSVFEGLPAFLIAVLCAFLSATVLKSMPVRAKPTPIELEARQVNQLLKSHLRERRLHKAGPDAVVTLLEESARQYQRIQTSLSTAFWRSNDLPPQYGALREKARLAADRAMQEIVVLLRPRLSETTKPQHWKDVMDEVAENIGLRTPDRGFVFPGDLEPASHLAEGLRVLANEVEQASIRAITEIPNANGAHATLRSTLSELRALNDAESELDASLRERL